MSTGYVIYSGAAPSYCLGRYWEQGTKASLEDLCNSYGEKAGDVECGAKFVQWMSNVLIGKKGFTMVLNTQTDPVEVSSTENQSSGFITVESSELIATADTPEQAAMNLSRQASSHGQQVGQIQPDLAAGTVEVGPESVARTARSMERISSVSQVKDSIKQESEPMTGDMLEVQEHYDYTGGVTSNTMVAQPEPTDNSNAVNKAQPAQYFTTNPPPSITPSKPFTGTEDIITNTPQVPNEAVQDFSNIQPIDQRSSKTAVEAPVMTGDNLDSGNQTVAAPSSESAEVVKASSATGTRPVVQGMAPSNNITLDHIVRASSVHQAIDAVNACKDRTILAVAKRQIDNAGGNSKVTDKIEARMQFLKERGM
jgi:hypothetical protein